MIDFFNAKTFIGKKVKLKFTKESLEKSEKNKEIIEENNEWLDKVLKKINFFKVSKNAINESLPVMGILMGVGMFIQIITLTGVRGYIVVNSLSLP